MDLFSFTASLMDAFVNIAMKYTKTDSSAYTVGLDFMQI